MQIRFPRFIKYFQLPLSKWQIKLLLVFGGFGILLFVVYYTQTLLNEVIEREQRTINLYADIFRLSLAPNANLETVGFLIDRITPTITFPIIVADKNNKPQQPYKAYSLNVDLDSTLSDEKQLKILMKDIERMRNSYPPIIIRDTVGAVVEQIYYSNSTLITRLRYFPFSEILIVAVFVIIGYLAFSNIRRNEESKVWVGMSKEAAHQLGTPLSSLMAWLEILKLNKDAPQAVEETAFEMENDITRLNTIATRFSKIGSKPEQKIENLSEIIESVCIYFQKRLPHIGRKVELKRNIPNNIFAEVNLELFQWVIENLLKNAAEAIESKHGIVSVNLINVSKKKLLITVKDSGKGMTNQQKRQAFNPGFTTKKRGWGLGLSLSKRIVEEYHQGKIYIKDTIAGKGTTFAIELPIIESKSKIVQI